MTTRVTKTSPRGRKPFIKPRLPPPHKKTLRRVLWLSLILLALLIYRLMIESMSLPAEGYRLKVGRGANWNTVADDLTEQGFILNPLTLRLWLWLHPGDEVLRSGSFILKPPLSVSGLVQRLAEKPDGAPPLVVIEGDTFATLRTKLQRDDVRQVITNLSDDELMRALGASEQKPEGLFAPDTYVLDDNERDLDILHRLYLRQQHILDEEWALRAPGLPYKTPYEALIMASIVEKETGLPSERSAVAGVFIRRLEKGMRLQTDPTVIYGLGAAYKGGLTRAQLRKETPYNTYRIVGLPPSPIAMPGRASIHAAMHPDASDAIYFVADGTGKHAFSATLEAHNANVQKYLESLRSAQAHATK